MYRYTLTYGSESKVLKPLALAPPVDWENLGYSLQESESLVNKKEFTDKLGFTGEVRTWINSIITSSGINIEISITIERKRLSTQTYETFFTGILDLTDFVDDKETFTVNLKEVGFNVDFNNRKADKIEYNSKYSLDGTEIYEVTNPFTDVVINTFSRGGVLTTETRKGAFPYELIDRIVQKITNQNRTVLKASIFGRTDLTSNGFANDYAADGDLSLIIVTKGLALSDIDFNGTTTKDTGKTDLTVSLMEVLDTYNAIQPIGMGIEEIAGVKYLVIEDLSYFYKNAQYTTVLGINDVTDIIRNVDSKMHNSKIENSFVIFSKTNDRGLADFTGGVEYATPLDKFNNVYSNKSSFSISPADIDYSIQNPVSGRSVDNNKIETDEGIFLIDCYRDGSDIKSRANSNGWSSVTTASIYGTNKLYTNLRIRPTINIHKHGKWYKTGLRFNAGEELTFLSSEQLSYAQTVELGDNYTTTDGTNIEIDDLESPILTGYKYSIRCIMNISLLREIQENKYWYLKFWDKTQNAYNYIWITKFTTNIQDGKAEIEGREVLNVTALSGGYMEFVDGSGYIEFVDGSGYMEFVEKTA